MTPLTGIDWLYPLVGWAITAVGGLWVLRLLIGDRSRGRRRCPRCWYDMTGAAALLCPECGKQARSEHHLFHTRRSKGRLALAGLVVLAGWVVANIPQLRQGWVRMVPTAVLARVAPADDAPLAPFQGFTMPVTAPAPSPTIGERLTSEMWRRIWTRKVSSGAGSHFVTRHLRNTPLRYEDLVTVPAIWPTDEPLALWVHPTSLSFNRVDVAAGVRGSGEWAVNSVAYAGMPAAAGSTVELDVELRHGVVLHRGTWHAPCRVRGTTDTFLDRVEDDLANEAVRAALAPRAEWSPGGALTLHFLDRSRTAEWDAIRFAVDFRVELRQSGRALAAASGTTNWRWPVWKNTDEVSLAWLDPGLRPTDNAPMTLLISGDPAASGRAFIGAPFAHPSVCWAGSFEIDLPPRPRSSTPP